MHLDIYVSKPGSILLYNRNCNSQTLAITKTAKRLQLLQDTSLTTKTYPKHNGVDTSVHESTPEITGTPFLGCVLVHQGHAHACL